MAWPATRPVRPSTSLEMGHSSRHTPAARMRCRTCGWRASAKPCPMRRAPSSSASTRFSSVAVPPSRVSPQWNRNGMDTPAEAHRRWKARNSGTKALSGWPLASSPMMSKPGTRVSGGPRHVDECRWRLSYIGGRSWLTAGSMGGGRTEKGTRGIKGAESNLPAIHSGQRCLNSKHSSSAASTSRGENTLGVQ